MRDFAGLSPRDIGAIRGKGIKLEDAERMAENVIGVMKVPLGIATNFLINGKDYLIPMATEESSVIAAASKAAKIARKKGGFRAAASEPLMIGQIQLSGENPYFTRKLILNHREKILALANEQDPALVKFGGGAKDLEVRVVKGRWEEMLIIHLLVDCQDAMGANAVNTMCEAIAPYLERITTGKIGLKIISNLADRRLAKAEVTVDKEEIGGEEVVDKIVSSFEFAKADPYRAVTHNKGIMNGISAIVLATGNDTRAVEAGAHGYAAMAGGYRPLSTWAKDKNGNLQGELKIPLAAGIIGGATSSKIAQVSLKILGVSSAQELAEVMAAVGLAQNLAALRALATEGIQEGHMKLHAKNIAQAAGAKNEEIDKLAEIMIKENQINFQRALGGLREIRKGRG